MLIADPAQSRTQCGVPATYIRNQSQLLIMCSELHFAARSKPLEESLTLF